MKIRLLEHATHGQKGEVLDLEDELAIALEKRGYAEFVGEDSEESSAQSDAEPEKETHHAARAAHAAHTTHKKTKK